MDERVEAQDAQKALSWHNERRHFEPRYSGVSAHKPHVKFGIKPPVADERPRGLRQLEVPKGAPAKRPEARHFAEQSRARSKEIDEMRISKLIVQDANGVPCRAREAKAYDLERAMGRKVQLHGTLQRRNGIDYKRPGDKLYSAAEYSTGYYNNATWGGGVVPGSNFGFARATQTTRESQKTFGKSLAELWTRCPEVPLVVEMCLERLESPEVLADPRVFHKAMLEYYDEEPVGETSNGSPGARPDGSRPPSKEGARSVKSTGRCSNQNAPGHLSASVTKAAELQAETDEANALLERRRQIRILRAKFDVGQVKGVDMAEFDPRVPMGLLIRFLRDLTPPLLTYTLYDKLMQSQLEPTPAARVEALAPALAMLPTPNEAVLFALFRLLNTLVNAPTDTAPVQTLTLVRLFTPVILRDDPRRPTRAFLQDESVQRALAEGVVTCMLENAAALFPASALRPRRRRAHIPFNLRRTLSLAVEDYDGVCSLSAWARGSGAEVDSAKSSSSSGSLADEDAEGADGRSGSIDDIDSEELDQLVRAYRNLAPIEPGSGSSQT